MPAEYGPQKFSEAIDFFRSKVDVPSERWADVWRAQHNNAFMIAGAVKTDLLADMRSIVDRAIAEGKSLSWFQKEFKHLVKKHGWDHTGTAAWRANIIYDTNMRQSYNAGRYQQLQTFPYWRYKHGDSRYPRPHHQSKNGLILPKDDPFWKEWFPQNGWGCRCKVFGENDATLRVKNLPVSNAPAIDTKEWIDKATGEVHHVPEGIDPGFNYAPGAGSQTRALLRQVSPKPGKPHKPTKNWQSLELPAQLPSWQFSGELLTATANKATIQKLLTDHLGTSEKILPGPVKSLSAFASAEFIAEQLTKAHVPYIAVLSELLANPQEVWTFWQRKTTSSATIRRRYLKLIEVNGNKQLLFAEVEKGILIRFSTLDASDVEAILALRTGSLLYQRIEE